MGALADGRLVVVVVWDGLRPDFLSPEVTPTLLELAGGGVWFEASHCVYPSETRVNASALATGCGPGRTGLTANSMYVPGFDPGRPDALLNTGDHTQLARLEALDGPLLRVPWVGQAIAAAGGAMVVASSGSPGSALLQNPSPQGITVNQAILRPAPVAETVLARFGAPPPDSFPATERSDWVTRALLEYLLPEVLLPRMRAGCPALAHWWLTDPDHTAHHLGLGAPDTVRSLGENDRRLAALMARLDDLGLRERTDVLLTSDHGFSTPGPPAGPGRDFRAALAAVLAASGAAGDGPVELFDTGQGGGAITFGPGAGGRAADVVRWLQGQPWVGAVLARDGGPAAGLPGTLPLSLAWGGQVGPRAPDLRFSPAWSDAPNLAGIKGAVAGRPAGGRPGATHGSASPYDMRNSLFAWGPRFKRGLRSAVPAGIVDVAPTVRQLLGLPATGADGRVLQEALLGGPEPREVDVVRTAYEAAAGDFRQRLRRAAVDGTSYLEGIDAWRE